MAVTKEMIMSIVTALITYLFGILSTKFNWIESKYIPIQNATIGIVAGVICYILKISEADMLTTIIYCMVGAMASGGTYDLTKTTNK